MRMLAIVGEFKWAKLYGTRGQDQEGIDAYARMRATNSSVPTEPPVRGASVKTSRESWDRSYR